MAPTEYLQSACLLAFLPACLPACLLSCPLPCPCFQHALITTFSTLWSPPSACSDHHLQHSLITTFSMHWTPPSACSDHHLQHALITTFGMLWSPPSRWWRVSWRWCSEWPESGAQSVQQVNLYRLSLVQINNKLMTDSALALRQTGPLQSAQLHTKFYQFWIKC